MKNLIFIIIVFSFLSCKTQKQITSDKSDSTVYIETLRFDTITTPADSSWLYANFKCDSLGNVYLAEIKDLKSKGLITSLDFTNGILNFATRREETKTPVPCVDRYFNRRIKETITITKTIIKMSLFQKMFFWTGILALLTALVTIYIKLKK